MTENPSNRPTDPNRLAEEVAAMLLAIVHDRLRESAADLPTAELLSLARILTAARRELPPDDDPADLPPCPDPPRKRRRNRRRTATRSAHAPTQPAYGAMDPADVEEAFYPPNPFDVYRPSHPHDRPPNMPPSPSEEPGGGPPQSLVPSIPSSPHSPAATTKSGAMPEPQAQACGHSNEPRAQSERVPHPWHQPGVADERRPARRAPLHSSPPTLHSTTPACSSPDPQREDDPPPPCPIRHSPFDIQQPPPHYAHLPPNWAEVLHRTFGLDPSRHRPRPRPPKTQPNGHANDPQSSQGGQ